MTEEGAGIAPLFLLRRGNSGFIRKIFTISLSFYLLLPIVLTETMIIIKAEVEQSLSSQLPWFFPGEGPQGAGTGNLSCTDGHLEALSLFPEVDKVGHDRFLCRIIYWRSVRFFIFLFIGLFPGEA
ncbi:MAG: hypothetical protein MUP25_06965 [Syntrophales bacterium]|nr:hypothetical protein [Syntrophales bacterium]